MDVREPGITALDPDAAACLLAFSLQGLPNPAVPVLAILAGLYAKEVTCECECYIRDGATDRELLVGVGLRTGDEELTTEWWGELADAIEDACAEDDDARLNRDQCGLTSVRELRATMFHAGTAGFNEGVATWVSDPVGEDRDSPFTFLCRVAR